MVPAFENFLYPCLKAFQDGKTHSVEDVRLFNAKFFDLTDEDCKELIASGARTKVMDRTSFGITYIFQAGLLMRIKRGQYVISNEGKELLNKDINSLTRKYLEENYSSFYDFYHNRKKSEKEKENTTDNHSSSTELTPHELIENAYKIMSSDLASQLLEEVKSNSPQFFEHLVVKLLVAMGYGGSFEDAAKVTKVSHDDGIDGVIKEDKLGLDSIYIQAKRYTVGSVQKPDMQKFIGALSEQGANKGIFITTSEFSSGAIETSKKAANVKIVLIDGKHLADYMIQYNIGVSIKQIYEIKKIDTDFFIEE